ncbi:MAG: hypothetical protein QXO55_06165 [Candidatus Korarchaeum sp.]
MTKLALLGIVLVSLSVVLFAFVRAQSIYQESQLHMSRIARNANSRTLSLLYCFTNATDGKIELHIYNYGSSDLVRRLAVFGSDGTLLIGDAFTFPKKRMTVVRVNASGPSSQYYLILIWPDSGEIDVVECIGS